MNNAIISIPLGIFYLILAFILCFIIVAGAKAIITSLTHHLKTEEQPKTPPAPKKIRKIRKPYKPVRSIEINPDEVDKIYVKKIS